MKPQSITWHEGCLRNQERTLAEREIRLRDEMHRVDQEIRAIRFYRLQISEAKKLGKTAFDADRFMKRRTIVKGT